MCGCLSLIACRVPQGSINSLGRCYPNLGIIAPLQVFWFLEAKFRPPSIWKPSGRAFSAHQARSATGCKLWGGAGPPSVRARPRICRIFPPPPTHPQILLPTKIEPVQIWAEVQPLVKLLFAHLALARSHTTMKIKGRR